MMFPGYGARIYRNEEGEVLGWDYPDRDDPYEPDDYLADPEDDDEHDSSDEEGPTEQIAKEEEHRWP
jgi:hypothetical protein